LQVADKMRAMLLDTSEDTIEAVGKVQELLIGVTTKASTAHTHYAKQVVDSIMDEMQAVARGEASIGLTTGFTDIDNISRLHGGKLWVVGGNTGMGKSVVMINVILRLLVDDVPVLVFSSEMNEREYTRRLMVCLMAQYQPDGRTITTQMLQNPQGMTKAELDYVGRAATKVAQLPLVISDIPNPSPSEVEAAIVKHQRQDGVQAVFVDGIYRMDTDYTIQDRREQVSHIVRKLKNMALRWGVPIVASHQANREAPKRQDKRPRLEDMADSSVVEQEADIIAFAYRDAYYYDDTDNTVMELVVRKNRDGDVGIVKFGYNAPGLRITHYVPPNKTSVELTRDNAIVGDNHMTRDGRNLADL